MDVIGDIVVERSVEFGVIIKLVEGLSLMYQFLSIMTVADPLSADLMMISSRPLSVVMACRSSLVKLRNIDIQLDSEAA